MAHRVVYHSTLGLRVITSRLESLWRLTWRSFSRNSSSTSRCASASGVGFQVRGTGPRRRAGDQVRLGSTLALGQVWVVLWLWCRWGSTVALFRVVLSVN